MSHIHWIAKPFHKLTNTEVYNMMCLRSKVFVVEQNCVYLDADGKDMHCTHLIGTDSGNTIIAYSRIVPAGISFTEVSIGRVLTADKGRGIGAGKELMQKSIEVIQQLYGHVSIRIGAQSYLKKFYENFGFIVVSNEYLEDNIPHVEMLRNSSLVV